MTGSRTPIIDQALQGAVDMHIHTSPDVIPRCVTAVAAAEAADQAGMGGIVVKSHSTDTSARAETTRDATGFPVFGGVVLNLPVGGINPHAVRESIKQGGRVISMPTLSARFFIQHAQSAPTLAAHIPPGTTGITAVHNERITPEVDQVLDIVAEADVVLASGHISPEETTALFVEARARGIRKLLVTHPMVDFVSMSLPDMRAMAELGAYLELTVLPPGDGREESVREVGVEHFVLSTDGGTTLFPPPVELLQDYATTLLSKGFTLEEVRTMTVHAPRTLLGLEAHSLAPVVGAS